MNYYNVAEVELIYKTQHDPETMITVTDVATAHSLLISNWDMNKIDLIEQFKIVLLNHNKTCLGISEISSGGISNCLVDPRIVFATAIKARATGIILAHNHPSGNKSASKADIEVTERLVKGGKILGVDVVEHMILTRQGYTSMASEGYIP